MNRQAQDLVSTPFANPPREAERHVRMFLEEQQANLERMRQAVLLLSGETASKAATPQPLLPDDLPPLLLAMRPGTAVYDRNCGIGCTDSHGRYCGYYEWTGEGSGDSSVYVWHSPWNVRGLLGETVGTESTAGELGI